MIRVLLTTAAFLIALALPEAAPRASVMEYNGLCEASAGVFLDDMHFAVATDESNVLQIYQRGKPDPVGSSDMEGFTSFDKSDLEGAARIGDRVYWISSHSFNKDGEDKAKRKVFFATQIGSANGKLTLTGVGFPAKALRDAIVAAAKVEPGKLNIEALAGTPEGGLLIGLRSPLRTDKRALVIPFNNPKAVIDNKAAPEFGEAREIDLRGNGLRAMALVGDGEGRYLIVAGPEADKSEGFALFRWAGPGSKPMPIDGTAFQGIIPEGAMAIPGAGLVQLLSDDGDICKDDEPESPTNRRRFRSIDVKP